MKVKLKKVIDYFTSMGYECHLEKDDEVLFFSRIENDTRKCVYTEFREVGEQIRLGATVIEYIQIDKVEDLVQIVTNDVVYYKHTISSINGVAKGGYMLEDYFWVKEDNDLNEYIEKLDTYYQSYIAPFFEGIPTLQSFNDKVLSVVSFDDYHHYISGEVGLKAMIIMRLCNNPLYDAYVMYREEEFKNSPYLYNPESRWHKVSKQSYEEFNKFKQMVEAGNA